MHVCKGETAANDIVCTIFSIIEIKILNIDAVFANDSLTKL